MNKKQIIILQIAGLMMGLSFIFSPWVYTLQMENGQVRKPAGYHFILMPPAPEKDIPRGRRGVELDISRLVVQFLIIGIFGGIELFMYRGDRKPTR